LGAVIPTESEANETAWRIHGALCDWTGKVDSKASFLSAIEAAVLAGVVTLAADGRHLSRLHGRWQLSLFWFGVATLVISILAVLWVVMPHLRGKDLPSEQPTNFIFFGHVKSWSPDELATALRESDPMPVLSRQLVNMAEIAWKKHRLLQLSIVGTVLGASLISLAAILLQLE
jgi:hypothetical protein